MNPRTYDLSMVFGTACCAASAWQLHGPAVALGVTGVLVLVSTVAAALLSVLAVKK